MLKKGRKYAFKRRPRTATNCAFPPLELEKKKNEGKKGKKKICHHLLFIFFLALFLCFCPFFIVAHLLTISTEKEEKKKRRESSKKMEIKYRRLTMYTPCHTVLHPTRKQCLCLACALQCRTLLHIYTSTYPLIDVSIHASHYVTTCLLVHPISLLIERPLP